MSNADEIVVVATPDLASLRNAKNIMDYLRAQRPNEAPARLILNQVRLPKRPEMKAAWEKLGATPVSVLLGGVVMLVVALALWTFNKRAAAGAA